MNAPDDHRTSFERNSVRTSFVGLTYAQALSAEPPPMRELVEGVIDIGTVGLLAGLPFSYKSWAGQELAEKTAGAPGRFLGRFPVLVHGPVVVSIQDDSDDRLLERIQAKAERHGFHETLPIRFLINEGIRLPDDLPELRARVEADRAILLLLDSFYNHLPPSIRMKDEEAGAVLAEIKREIADPTGCTVPIVDHTPWPTDQNHGQRRAYGTVFKTAAARWTIHFETDAKDPSRVHLRAQGNNVVGFPRTAARWDPNSLELRVDETDGAEDGETPPTQVRFTKAERAKIERFHADGISGTEIAKRLGRRKDAVLAFIRDLEAGSGNRLGTTGTALGDGSQDGSRTGACNAPGTGGTEPVPELVPDLDQEEAPGALLLGDEGFDEVVLLAAFNSGHVTNTEAEDLLDLHRAIVAANGGTP